MLRLFRRAVEFTGRTALVDPVGTHSYDDLVGASAAVADTLLGRTGDLDEARVAFLVPPGADHVATQWGIWRAGGIAVPLAMSHPAEELAHTIEDAGADIVVVAPGLVERVSGIALRRSARLIVTEELKAGNRDRVDLAQLDLGRRAMLLYTSGTTSRPKGVVITHGNLQAQVETLVDAWGWSANDHILLVLPLHHVHGIVNVLTCALWSGAKCTIHPGFDPERVWSALSAGDLTLFMAVPTIYGRLAAAWEEAAPERRAVMSAGCRKLRLMVSGSAALPVTLLERWRELSGHTLLERYGMTEIGMALSNPLHGERRPGHVGVPLPGVEVRLVDESGSPVPAGVLGEIEVRGPSVFTEYWRRPEETRESFREGWFRTGDIAVIDAGYYRILGRSNVDILKTGGFKVSALEIEEVVRLHPDVADCAVVGAADDDWGERVCVAVVPRAGATPTLAGIREWAAQRLAPYKIPRTLEILPELPRNAMGKVSKAEVRKRFD
jgi:malonyl-CoA/methylmalonyl-CoA synthetase